MTHAKRFIFISMGSVVFAWFNARGVNLSQLHVNTPASLRDAAKNSPYPKGVSSWSPFSLSPLATPGGVGGSWIKDGV